jgi:hypothetical protein
MTWTDNDTVCTIGLAFFSVLAFVYAVFWCCIPPRKQREAKPPASDVQIYVINPTFLEMVFFYVIACLLLAAGYFITADYVGGGTISYTSPCNGRGLVVYGRVLLNIIAYGLASWPLITYAIPSERRSFDVLVTVLTSSLVFVGFAFAALSRCDQWIGAVIAIVFAVLFVIYVLFTGFTRKLLIVTITASVLFVIKVVEVNLTSVVGNVFGSVWGDALADLIVDVLFLTVVPALVLYFMYHDAYELMAAAPPVKPKQSVEGKDLFA